MRHVSAIVAFFGLIMVMVVLGMLITSVGAQTDALTSLSGGLDTFLDRIEILFLFVGGGIGVGALIVAVQWFAVR